MSHDDPLKTLLTDRGAVHGDWKFNATVQHTLKEQVRAFLEDRNNEGLPALEPWRIEAIDLICVKLSRIIAGDPSHADHWDDIAGYARLGRGG